MQPGTARKPAARKALSSQPANFDGTLSHQAAPPGPPAISALSLRRKESSTAFFSHWLTFQELGPVAPAIFSATRALPLSSRSSARSTASRTSPVVARTDLRAILVGLFDKGLQRGVGHHRSPAGFGAGRFGRRRGRCQWRGPQRRRRARPVLDAAITARKRKAMRFRRLVPQSKFQCRRSALTAATRF